MFENSTNKNIAYIANADLCCGCAACQYICPSNSIKIKINYKKGIYLPIISESNCNKCGLCVSVCPGEDADLFSESSYIKTSNCNYNSNIGYYYDLFAGYSLNKKIHQNGASGGITSELLIYLLENKLVDGVIVTVMDHSEPLLAIPVIARSKEDILKAQQSKYCPVPLLNILKMTKKRGGRYAVVGLPCHIKAINKIKKIDKVINERIYYTIGLFCSRTPNFNATFNILKKKGIKPDEIKTLNYRAGEMHMGHMQITLINGETIKIPHLSYDYWGFMFSNFFMPMRCYLCPDKVAVLADLSIGDNWHTKMCHFLGSSTLIVRRRSILSIIKKMEKKRIIELSEATADDIIETQELHKKQDIGPRIFWRKLFGGKIPKYGSMKFKKVSLFQKIMSLLLFIRTSYTLSNNHFYTLNIFAYVSFISQKFLLLIKKTLNLIIKISLRLLSIFTYFLPAKKIIKKTDVINKILIIGGYGSKDIGDEAMPHTVIRNFKKLCGNNLKITMLSVNPSYTKEYHNEHSIKDVEHINFIPYPGVMTKLKNLHNLIHMFIFIFGAFCLKNGIHLRLWPSAHDGLHEISSTDLIFNVGGGNLNSLIPQEFYKKGVFYIAALILNKPVIVSGQTMGPFEGIRDIFFAKLTLNIPKMITFRDKNISYTRCKNVGIKKPKIQDTADDAMTLPYIDKDEAIKLLCKDTGVSNQWLSADNSIICMNLKGSLRIFKTKGRNVSLDNIIKTYSYIADFMLDNFCVKIIFIPTDFCPGVDDRMLHRQIIAGMKSRDKIASLEKEYTDIELKGIINLCDMAIGARYHFCVFASSLHKPFLGIASGVYQMTKLKGLSLLCGLPECFFEDDLDEADLNKLTDRIKTIINRKKIIEKQLEIEVPKLKEKSLLSLHYAIELLSKKPESNFDNL